MIKPREAVAPAYLFACIVMGGSAQGVLSNLILQLVGLALLVWAISTRISTKQERAVRFLWWLAAAAVAVVGLQLVPLPPALWSGLPGRQLVVDGFRLLGQPLPWMPLSLAPADTIGTALAFIPPLAMLALIGRLGAYRDDWLVFALLFATIISIVLGIVQLRGDGMSYYLYPYASWGTAAGLFANANHMATLLLVAVPFLAALAVQRWREDSPPNSRSIIAILAGGAAIALAVGAALNHSLALLAIGVPVIALAGLLMIPAGRVRLGRLAATIGLLFVIGTAALSVAGTEHLSPSNRTSVALRTDIWSHSANIVRDYGLAGSGIGTFPKLYPLYENAATIDRTYINHAHDDYLELAIEGGIPITVLMVLFLAWWGWRTIAIWRSPEASLMARAATIAAAAILLHSLVDYPLRTSAIAACMAMALALMAEPKRRVAKPRLADLRPARHLTL